jgi:signal peptidase I
MSTTSSPQRLARRMLRRAGDAVIVIALLLSLAWVVTGQLGYQRYVITGGSMSGAFEVGAIAFEQAVPVGKLEVGDVITYLPPPDSGVSDLVTHRIVDIDTDPEGALLFQTQGDANADPDPWAFTLPSATQPVVQFTVPSAGYLLIALSDPLTRMLVIGGPAAVVAALALLELVRAFRPERATATAHAPGTGTATP